LRAGGVGGGGGGVSKQARKVKKEINEWASTTNQEGGEPGIGKLK